jgi:hypothetical protein
MVLLGGWACYIASVTLLSAESERASLDLYIAEQSAVAGAASCDRGMLWCVLVQHNMNFVAVLCHSRARAKLVHKHAVYLKYGLLSHGHR